jgi:hypothetical protein
MPAESIQTIIGSPSGVSADVKRLQKVYFDGKSVTLE